MRKSSPSINGFMWGIGGLALLIVGVGLLWIVNSKEGIDLSMAKPVQQALLQEVNRATITAMQLNNRKLPKDIKLENIQGDTITIGDLAKGGGKLVMQYSELNCDVCVDSTLSYVQLFGKNTGIDHAAIIATTANRRYLIQFARLNRLPASRVYMIPVKQTELLYSFSPPAPFVYVLDSSGTATDVFFPIKENPEQSAMYFRMISNKHFTKP